MKLTAQTWYVCRFRVFLLLFSLVPDSIPFPDMYKNILEKVFTNSHYLFRTQVNLELIYFDCFKICVIDLFS